MFWFWIIPEDLPHFLQQSDPRFKKVYLFCPGFFWFKKKFSLYTSKKIRSNQYQSREGDTGASAFPDLYFPRIERHPGHLSQQFSSFEGQWFALKKKIRIL
jgi:hypothetical protein